jgi:hypothetical protein
MMSGNRDLIIESYRRLGIDTARPDIGTVFADYLLPFAENVARLGRDETFDFKANTGFVDQVGRYLITALKTGKLLEGFTSESVFIDRTHYGIFRILDAMGAEVSYRHPLYKLEV